MSVQRHGQCVCGKVKISATKASNKVGACHCGICRRWGGGPLLAIDCGTHLFYRLSQNDQYIMPVGLFDNADDLVFDHQVCIDSKPAFYNFAEPTHNMTCDEMFAAFAPSQ